MDRKIRSLFVSLDAWKIILLSVIVAVFLTNLVTVLVSIWLWHEVQIRLIILGTINAILVPILTLPAVIGLLRKMIKLEGQNQALEDSFSKLESQKQIESALQRRADEMSLLYQLGISVASGRDLYSTLLTLQVEITQLINADAFFVAIYNQDTDVVSYPIFFDEGKLTQESGRVLHEQPGLTGFVIFNNRTLYLPDMMTPDVEEIYHPYDTSGPVLHTFLGIPLITDERVIGMLSVQSKLVDAYSQDQIQLMENIAVQAAIAIDKARLLDQLQLELAERKRAEQALLFSEGKFYKAFHTTPVLMSIEDSDNRFVDVNRAFENTIGYKREEVIGRRASDLQLWGSPQDMQASRQMIQEQGQIKDLELRFRRRSGEIGFVLMSSEKFDVNGMIYSLTSALDITERKQVETALQNELEDRKRITADLLQREALLNVVAYAAELFLKSADWRDEINTVLERLGKTINVCHVYLFENHAGPDGILLNSIRFEWTAPSCESDLDNPEFNNVSLHDPRYENWYELLSNGQPYIGGKSTFQADEAKFFADLGIKAILDMPIFVNSNWWGTIGFDDTVSARDWSVVELDMLKVIANLLGAAIRRQLADATLQDELVQRRKLIDELEAKNAESETLRETTAIVAATLDTSESVQRILEQLKRVIPYDSASVWLYKDDMAIMVGWDNLSEEARMPGEYVLGETEPDYPFQLNSVPYILLDDIQENYPVFRKPHLNYIHGWLAIPLLARGKLTGFISLDGHERGQFTEHDAQLALTYASQVSIALENARLFSDLQTELEERKKLIAELEIKNAESETLRESVAIVAATLEQSEAIGRILEQLRQVVPYDSASVQLIHGEHLEIVGGQGLLKEFGQGMLYPINDNEPSYPIIKGEQPYLLFDNVQDSNPNFNNIPHNNIHSWLAIPLKIKGNTFGVITLDGYEEGKFTERHAELAVTYANQVGIALENARLFTELQEELKVKARLIEELESKNAELERFTYTVSHDLKSPLITIRGFLGFIEQDTASGNVERLRADVKRISDATEKMQRLLQELLDLSRIGRLKNESTFFSFTELAREIVETVQGRIHDKKIVVNIQPDMPVIFGDRARLLEVLQNLVENSTKFMGDQPNPLIEIGQEGEEDGKPIFFVRDNGVGIAPDHYERVFGLFNKLDSTTEGTGVGLAIVKRIIEIHGGRIWVKGDLGKGATFYFTVARDG